VPFTFLVVGVLSVLTGGPVNGEPYLAAQVGLTIPNQLTNTDLSTCCGSSTFTQAGDRSLANSVMYGGKFGYFSDRWRWLGLEAEAFSTTPNRKQEMIVVTGPSGSQTVPFQGSYMRVTTAALNVVARYPGQRFQPYAAVGPGLFFTTVHVNENIGSQNSTSIGLNTQLGLRFLWTDHIAMFGEWKYNLTRLQLPTNNDAVGQNQTYSANLLVFGVGYHF
jgi:opacity protein-like surface antigen